VILSFHPIIEADQNIIVAGRQPDDSDLRAIQQADAVIVSQGCSEVLYRMVRQNCAHVFPNLDVRFDYPGKSGQIELFSQLGIAHPRTRCFASLTVFDQDPQPVSFPAVVKLDWGGQGETVFKVTHSGELEAALKRAAAFELSGQHGFLIQQYIPCGQRCLRVVVIGTRILSYWRLQRACGQFGTSVASGAAIDYEADPVFQDAARKVARNFCAQTGLQLAGFDFIFSEHDRDTGTIEPLMLEINYYFGRTGLGGSDAYYRILEEEVDKWLSGIGFDRPENL
jgi:ribosomal protein S6--L-glutamate ligase